LQDWPESCLISGWRNWISLLIVYEFMTTRRLASAFLGAGLLFSVSAFCQVTATPAPLANPPTPPGFATNAPPQAFSPSIKRGLPGYPLPFPPPSIPQHQPTAAATVPPGYPAPLATPGRPATPQPVVNPVLPKPPTQPATYIAWDAESKEYNAKPGDSSAHFTFYLTNVSKEVVMVNSVHTSCGCTVAQLPEQPWHLAAGANGPINVTVNLAGKSGTIVKSVTVDTTAGIKSLLVKVNIPTQPGQQPIANGLNVDRMRNMQTALADRQAVFKNDCATCHAKPAFNTAGAPIMGAPLYAGVCANCHDSANRAALVPDLKKLNHPTGEEHWRKWIASGKVGSMMPAFSKSEGGPLNDAQIESLVKYLNATIPSVAHPAVGATKPVAGPLGTSSKPGVQ